MAKKLAGKVAFMTGTSSGIGEVTVTAAIIFAVTQPEHVSISEILIRPTEQVLSIGLSWFSVCQFWGVKPIPVVQKAPITRSIPTLILQMERRKCSITARIQVSGNAPIAESSCRMCARGGGQSCG